MASYTQRQIVKMVGGVNQVVKVQGETRDQIRKRRQALSDREMNLLQPKDHVDYMKKHQWTTKPKAKKSVFNPRQSSIYTKTI